MAKVILNYLENLNERGSIKQVKGYLELDKIKAIPKLRSFLLIGSKDGVEFIKVSGNANKLSKR